MSVEFKPTNTIIAELGFSPNGEATKFLTSECAKAMDKYVPFRPGSGVHLRQYKITGNQIIYDQPYARYQYYGIREDGTHKVENYTTPGTGPYWDKRMVSADLPNIVKNVQDRFGGK